MFKTVLSLCCFCLCSSIYAQHDTTIVAKDSLVPAIDTIPISHAVYTQNSVTNQPVYKLKPAIDVPLTAVNTAWSLYAFTKIYSKPVTPEETVLSLDKNNINWFDRWGVRPYDANLDRISYIPFNAAMPLPLVFLVTKKTRQDFFKLTFLYLEAMSITGVLYTGSVYLFNRYRPYVYSPETAMEQRVNGGGKNSFYAGHPALIATSTFFVAKVYSDYYPQSKIKWLLYTLAGSVTVFTAYLRQKGGLHFPTDLLLGVTQGALTGVLVPHFHKHKIIKDPNLSLVPYYNGESHGLSVVYRLK